MTNTTSRDEPDAVHQVVRHTLATLAYRASKAVRNAPAEFGDFHIGPTTRTPNEILTHMGDLMDWALTMAQGQTQWRDGPVQRWSENAQRFFSSVTALDKYLAEASPEIPVLLKLFQGPIADAITHTGQLTMLRRLAGSPVRGESYQLALIAAGQTGIDQPAPQREFDS
jgi:hypothetical protein